MSAHVRQARREDLARIIELLAQMSLPGESREAPSAPPAPEYEAAFLEIEADPRQELLVAEVDGAVLGTATLLFFPNLSYRGRPIAQLESVVVDASARGRGIGEALVRYAVDRARRRGCVRVQLTSNLARKDAHRFYERLGFSGSHLGMKLWLDDAAR